MFVDAKRCAHIEQDCSERIHEAFLAKVAAATRAKENSWAREQNDKATHQDIRETSEGCSSPSKPWLKSEVTQSGSTGKSASSRAANALPGSKKRWHLRGQIAFVSCGLVAGGMVATVQSIQDLALFAGADRATCSLSMFEALDLRQSWGVSDDELQAQLLACTEVSCGFEVKATSSELGEFYVRNFMPPKVTNYEGGARAGGDPFRCCPSWSLTLRYFHNKDAEQFCDNLEAFDGDCPAAPWDCYVFNLGDKLMRDEGPFALAPPSIFGEDLHIGNTERAIPQLVVGLLLCSAGCLAAQCLRQRVRVYLQDHALDQLRDWSSRTLGQFQNRCFILYMKVVESLPESYRTHIMMDHMVRAEAATQIQRHARGFLVRQRLKRRVDVVVETPSRESNVWQGWNFMRRKDRKVPFDGGAPKAKRKELSRVVSEPGDAAIKIEVVLDVDAPNFGVHLSVVSAFIPPVIRHVAETGIGANYGLYKGMHLIQVVASGGTTIAWPKVSGANLVRGLHRAPRPAVLTFQGSPGPPAKPAKRTPKPPPALPPELWPKHLRPKWVNTGSSIDSASSYAEAEHGEEENLEEEEEEIVDDEDDYVEDDDIAPLAIDLFVHAQTDQKRPNSATSCGSAGKWSRPTSAGGSEESPGAHTSSRPASAGSLQSSGMRSQSLQSSGHFQQGRNATERPSSAGGAPTLRLYRRNVDASPSAGMGMSAAARQVSVGSLQGSDMARSESPYVEIPSRQSSFDSLPYAGSTLGSAISLDAEIPPRPPSFGSVQASRSQAVSRSPARSAETASPSGPGRMLRASGSPSRSPETPSPSGTGIRLQSTRKTLSKSRSASPPLWPPLEVLGARGSSMEASRSSSVSEGKLTVIAREIRRTPKSNRVAPDQSTMGSATGNGKRHSLSSGGGDGGAGRGLPIKFDPYGSRPTRPRSAGSMARKR